MTAFGEDYFQARAAFRHAAGDAGARVEAHACPAPGPGDRPLHVDVAWLGPRAAARVLLVVSGVHGAEGFAGSAAQIDWLRRAASARPDGVAVALVHALNPFGFAWLRRVNEHNVDLNRNFIDHATAPLNADYERLAPLLTPRSWSAAVRLGADLGLLAHLLRRGARWTQSAISRGQHRHADGLFYGGAAPAWSRRVMESVLADIGAHARELVVIDIHTGLGPRGRGELISTQAPGAPAFERARNWFGARVRSAAAGQAASPALTGEFLAAVATALPRARTTALTLEFGTCSLRRVLMVLRAENWAWRHAEPGCAMRERVAAAMRRTFCPSDPAWRRAMLSQARQDLLQALRRLNTNDGGGARDLG